MPLYEYECDNCMRRYNSDIDSLVKKLTKTNASRIMKNNPNFRYIEVENPKTGKVVFSLGSKGERDIRRYRYKLDERKVLYLEIKNFRFTELVYDSDDAQQIVCPLCGREDAVRRVFSTFKAIFDDKNKRAPGPGDELQWHLEYKQQKDEEIRNEWVGYDYLNQYFNN